MSIIIGSILFALAWLGFYLLVERYDRRRPLMHSTGDVPEYLPGATIIAGLRMELMQGYCGWYCATVLPFGVEGDPYYIFYKTDGRIVPVALFFNKEFAHIDTGYGLEAIERKVTYIFTNTCIAVPNPDLHIPAEVSDLLLNYPF